MALFARYTSQLPAVLLLFMCTLLKNAGTQASSGGLPGQPSPPTANSVSMHVIDILWTDPSDTGAGITGYNVQWQVVGKLIKNQKVVTGSRTAKLDVTPYTEYDIQVRAYNGKGHGPWSWPLRVRSKESDETCKCCEDGCSSYTFNVKSSRLDWEKSRKLCKTGLGDLVSIESDAEWTFLKNIILNLTKADEYFIGLKKDEKSGKWRWLSNKRTMNTSLWALGVPNGDGKCAIMFKDYRREYGKYDDLPCRYTVSARSGYICERPVDSCGQEGKESTTKPATTTKSTTTTKPATTQSSTSQPRGPTSTATPVMNTVEDLPSEETTRKNTKVIIIVLALLAFLILTALIVFYVMYVRRRRTLKSKIIPLVAFISLLLNCFVYTSQS